jgi:P27 family predicted phage terminase small subunit
LNVLITEIPPAPDYLCEVGRDAWDRTCSYLVARRLLHAGDLNTVSAFCQVAARHRALERAIAGAPVGPEGKPHPAQGTANQTAATLAKLASMLALGPVTRGRLGAEARKVEDEPEDVSGLGEILKMRRARSAR